ncbi:MAG: hypothetical protein ABIJ59_05450 [Pseudomonadota bacterium]
MISVLMVSWDKHFFKGLETVFTANKIDSKWSDTGAGALSMLEENNPELILPELILIDEKLPDMTGRQFIEQVVQINPAIDCVVASGLSQKDFHQTYEGFGVLMQFPVRIGLNQGQMLLEHLKKIQDLQVNINKIGA